MNIIKIEEEIFRVQTLFIVNCSLKELKDYIKKSFNADIETMEDEDESDGTVLLITGKEFQYRIVWLESFKNTPKYLGILAHEVFHLVIRICEGRGVGITANLESGECGDETPAYLTNFYIKKFLEEYTKVKQWKKKKKKKKT
jgi:hypothetical protein